MFPSASSAPNDGQPRRVGRYVLAARLASGGMSSVHVGRLVGAAGFGRTVAIKQLHPHLAAERAFAAMLLDEARLASRVRHTNVVSVDDVVQADGQLLLVMEYVPGVSLSELLRLAEEDRAPLSPAVVSAIGCGILRGLHAAHEASDERGRPLGIVHRDVSPQNILVGADGIARLVDFGVAKAFGRLHTTVDGQLKGKLRYMAPEQLGGGAVDRRADIYAAGLTLWEALTMRRPFGEDSDAPLLRANTDVPPPSSVMAGIPPALDDLLSRALARTPARRTASARQMADELEAVIPPASTTEVAAVVAELAHDLLRERAALVAGVERSDFTALEAPPVREPATPVSSVTVVERPQGFGRRARVLAGAAVLLGLSAAAFFVVGGFRRFGSSPAVTPPAAQQAPVPAAPVVTAAVPESPPAKAAEPEAAPAAPAARRERRAGMPRPGSPSPRSPAKRHPESSARSNHCVPPFTIGPDGVKRYKVECL